MGFTYYTIFGRIVRESYDSLLLLYDLDYEQTVRSDAGQGSCSKLFLG